MERQGGMSGIRISHRRGAEYAEKEFLIKRSSELCDLYVSAVKTGSKRSTTSTTYALGF
jgi:hypothetical protein